MHPLLTSRRLWLTIAGVLLVVLLIAGVGGWLVVRQVEPWLHQAIVSVLAERFDSEVTLEALDVTIWPVPALRGEGLTLRYQGRTDLPPLITVRAFSGAATFASARRRQVDEIVLDGLEVTIPPRRRADMPRLDGEEAPGPDDSSPQLRPLIGRLTAANTRLTVMSRDPDKSPKVFDVHHLVLTNVSLDGPADFEAALTNPVPVGDIDAQGAFGPWQSDDPSLTPLSGHFTFDASLDTIKGIAGDLASSGTFDGVLERIAARGGARVPAFRLPTLTDAPVPVDTTFDAVVDGTNGDVYLTSVEALVGGSRFDVSGAIVRVENADGRRIALALTADRARVEDVLRLLVDGQRPPLEGVMRMTARLDIAPGPEDLVDKLWMDGTFALSRASFRSEAVQAQIDELSRRAQGRPDDAHVDDVVSDMEGTFTLKDQVLTLPLVTFEVTGARVQMAGTYGVRSEALAFRGDVRMDAPVSRMVTGVRSWLLRPFDPLLRKHGAGTRVAIKVEGTKDQPEFGIEIGRTLRGQ